MFVAASALSTFAVLRLAALLFFLLVVLVAPEGAFGTFCLPCLQASLSAAEGSKSAKKSRLENCGCLLFEQDKFGRVISTFHSELPGLSSLPLLPASPRFRRPSFVSFRDNWWYGASISL